MGKILIVLQIVMSCVNHKKHHQTLDNSMKDIILKHNERLSGEDLEEASNLILKHVQQEYFSNKLSDISQNKPVKTTNWFSCN